MLERKMDRPLDGGPAPAWDPYQVWRERVLEPRLAQPADRPRGERADGVKGRDAPAAGRARRDWLGRALGRR